MGTASSHAPPTPPPPTDHQVWWRPLDPVDFPAALVKKYAGKGMAILGWEIDQVRRTPDGDVSVPISATYNHHFTATMIGAAARFDKVTLTGPDDPRAAALKEESHGVLAYDQPHYVVTQVRDTTVAGAAPHTVCSSANGGEYRKSYHG